MDANHNTNSGRNQGLFLPFSEDRQWRIPAIPSLTSNENPGATGVNNA
jgi:hypothetical protein